MLPAVARIGILNREPELPFAPVSLVVIEGVVPTIRDDQIFRVHRTAEELDAVVLISEHFHILDRRATADSAQGQAINLVVRPDQRAAVTNRNITNNSRIIGFVVAAEDTARFVDIDPLDIVGDRSSRSGRTVERRPSQDDQSAPESPIVSPEIFRIVHVVVQGRENDRLIRRAFGENLSAPSHDQGTGFGSLPGLALDHGARFDRQRLSVLDKDQTVQHVDVVSRPSHLALNGIVCYLNRSPS